MTEFGFRNNEPYPYAYHYSNGVLSCVEFSDGSIRTSSTTDFLLEVLRWLQEQRRRLDQMIAPTEFKEKQQTSNDTDIVEDHFPNSDGVDKLEKEEPFSEVHDTEIAAPHAFHNFDRVEAEISSLQQEMSPDSSGVDFIPSENARTYLSAGGHGEAAVIAWGNHHKSFSCGRIN
ncbi:hypothetical protein K7X08_003684 [Anisodus acutangulus]|uniref:Uncharacterized protein n=1 Tax=Anisodus acutangulus TaxID=402998 RepID=A0A9Q1MJ03_9SOLA|nr:hypothetical protein K7X08_003684 [Anisodus acutangulus]